MKWTPSLGAWPSDGGVSFAVWAPDAASLEVVVEGLGRNPAVHSLEKSSDGVFRGTIPEIVTGDLYRYRIDGEGPYPDPASRCQPEGVHGPSRVIDPRQFPWTDQEWTSTGQEALVLYEMHVGAFTPEGTFAAAQRRLPLLRDLGVTAVELMPVADFPGNRNWGYDGAALFAPARCYGSPDDLRRFVNQAHRMGLGVHLDVVYNHFGPDGAYAGVFSRYYFSRRHHSPWGAGANLDESHCAPVRRFFIENALHWVHEYHVDGLRLDATHSMVDGSPRHFLAELSASVRDSLAPSRRRVLLIAEDHRNLACVVKPESEGGWGLDAVWSDDFHHQMRRYLTGDSDGYFQDFDATAADIATTVKQGWFYTGQRSEYFGCLRGTDPEGISPSRFVFFIQNHDQVGNPAAGDRLHHRIDLASYRAATVLLLLAPQTPLLFMGQEWGATTPFQFFIDHCDELGRRVAQGRKREFRCFAAFADPESRKRIPDPRDAGAFQTSRLDWRERATEPHASLLRLHQRLLALRREEPALCLNQSPEFAVAALGDDTLVLRRGARPHPAVLAVVHLRGSGTDELSNMPLAEPGPGLRWEPILTTEEAAFATDPAPPEIRPDGPAVEFSRPGAVILKLAATEAEQRR